LEEAHTFLQSCESALVSSQVRIKLFFSIQIWIRIQGAKPMRIRIQTLVRLLGHKNLNFYMKNILKVGYRSKNIHTKVLKPFERQESKFICEFRSISVLLDSVMDPDPKQIPRLLMFLGLHDPAPSLFVRIHILPSSSKKK
jgi:hypothetical protein